MHIKTCRQRKCRLTTHPKCSYRGPLKMCSFLEPPMPASPLGLCIVNTEVTCKQNMPIHDTTDEVDQFSYTVTKMSWYVILLTSVWALSYYHWQILSISFNLTQFLTLLPLECSALLPKHVICSIILLHWMGCYASISQNRQQRYLAPHLLEKFKLQQMHQTCFIDVSHWTLNLAILATPWHCMTFCPKVVPNTSIM